MIDRNKPVWVKGRCISRTRRALNIQALDKNSFVRSVTIPAQYVQDEQKLAGQEMWRFKVPQWQAFQHKLVGEEV